MLARHRIHLRALEPGKGLGKVRRESGRGYGSLGSEGAARLPSLLFAQGGGVGRGADCTGGNAAGETIGGGRLIRKMVLILALAGAQGQSNENSPAR